MPFSSGTFTRVHDWTDDRDNGVKIRADRMDEEFDGIATALTACLLKDGTQTVTANIPMAGFKITGLGNATASGDAVHYGQLSALSDAVFAVVDNADATKKLAFQLSGVTTATTRTVTWPDADLTFGAYAPTLLNVADESAFKTAVNLEIGTDVQAYDATLTSLAALGTAADKFAYTTGVDTWAEADITSFARGLLDDADAATARTTLGIPFGPASASTAAYLDFAEDTDNGTNRIRLIGPAAVTSDVDLTLPDGTGTVARTTDFLGQQTMWIPAAAMTPATTNGAEAGTLEMSSNVNMISYMAFDASTPQFAEFHVQMPKGWNESSLVAQFVWTHPATTTNFGVVWAIFAVACGDGDSLDVAQGSQNEVTDTGGTTYDCYITDETGAITVGGSPGAEEYVNFRIRRSTGNGADTMAVDAYLLGVKIHYTIDAAKDD